MCFRSFPKVQFMYLTLTNMSVRVHIYITMRRLARTHPETAHLCLFKWTTLLRALEWSVFWWLQTSEQMKSCMSGYAVAPHSFGWLHFIHLCMCNILYTPVTIRSNVWPSLYNQNHRLLNVCFTFSMSLVLHIIVMTITL